MALGDRDEHLQDGTGLAAEAVLWIGPDAVGPTYLMNPTHPAVREKILAVTDALLDKVGDLVDAFVIDEAYYIGYGELAPASCPGYADQAQATLIREIAARCHAFRPSLALLTADHLGTQTLEGKAYPYSLFADGIYLLGYPFLTAFLFVLIRGRTSRRDRAGLDPARRPRPPTRVGAGVARRA